MARIKTVKGNYYGVWYDRARKPTEKSYPLRTKTKRGARKKLNRLERAFETGDFDPWKGGFLRTHVTPDEAAERFLSAKAETVRSTTLRQYRHQIRACLDTVGPRSDLRQITGHDLRPFVHDASVSAATRRTRYRHANAFFRWCQTRDFLDDNPLASVPKPRKEQKEAAFLKPADVERLRIAIDHHVETTTNAAGKRPDLDWLRDLIPVAVATGLRRGELVAIRWTDVDLDAGSIHVRHRDGFTTKGNRERRVPLVGEALEILRRKNAERDSSTDGPVFTDRRGLPVKKARISHRFKDMARLAGLDERIHFHSLRHTCASWLAMKGIPMRVIQAILGHSSVSITERYSHLAPDTLDAAMRKVFG